VGVFVAVGLLLLKGKGLLLLLLTKAKFLLLGLQAIKLSTLLTTLGTMGVTIGVYAHYYGLALAAGFVLLILVHELGHGAAARAMGLKVGAPVFIPFFGAFIALREQLRSSWVDCVIGFFGPFAGMLGALATLAVGRAVADPYWSGLLVFVSWMTFYLNLFNLIPLGDLDGDRISRPVRAGAWALGTVSLLAIFLLTAGGARPNVILLTIVCVCAWKTYHVWRKERGAAAEAARLVDRLAELQAPRYSHEAEVEPWQRRAAAIGYFGLAAALTIAAHATQGWIAARPS
jgi:Zn-dependent protease